MAGISIKVEGLAGVQDMIRNLKIKTPQKIATSLNNIATTVKSAEVDEMKRVFDRPTPWALGAITTKKATPDDLQSKTDIREAAKASYLLPQIEGGSRPFKHFERVLFELGMIPSGWFAVPGKDIGLDNYGNVSGANIKVILNTLRGTGKAALKRKGSIWVVLQKIGNVRPGIYDVSNYTGWGGRMKCLFIYVSKVQYKQLFKFYEHGKQVFSRDWKGIVEKEVNEMLKEV